MTEQDANEWWSRAVDLVRELVPAEVDVIAPRAGQVGGLAHRAWVEAGERVVYLG